MLLLQAIPSIPIPVPVQAEVVDSGWAIFAAVATAVAAIATLTVALLTYRLAKSTSGLAAETKRLADETQILAARTNDSIEQTQKSIDAEDRRHRNGLQPHIMFRSELKTESGNFAGYTVSMVNIGPGYAWDIDLHFVDMDMDNEPTSTKLKRGQPMPDRGRTRPHSTWPKALGSGASCPIATLADNDDTLVDLRATYRDAFGTQFESKAPVYRSGGSPYTFSLVK